MRIDVLAEKPESVKCDLFATGLFEGEKPTRLSGLDKLISGAIRKAVSSKEFSGEFGETRLITTLGNLPAKNILLIGLGKKKNFTREKLRRASSIVSNYSKNKKYKIVATDLNLSGLKYSAGPVTEGIILGHYKFERKSKTQKNEIKSVSLLETRSNMKIAKKYVEIAAKICDNVMMVRDLVNLPASEITPTEFSKKAKKLAGKKVKVRVFGKKELKKRGFNAHLAVARGSNEEPKLVILEYGSKGKPFVLIGKGVTFDAGGLNIKPWKAMRNMRSDMAGAATVMGVIKTIADLNLPVHVIGLMPLAENMLGGSAYKPGDIIKSFNGKTIEILHTDAEGRLLLADSLGYADSLKPKGIIDIATLTGACFVALGYHAAAVMGNKKIIEDLKKASEETDEIIWELPLLEEHKDDVKSEIADVKNIGDTDGAAGAITAGAFLSNFTKSPWVHIDIAGTGWFNKDFYYIKAGGTGFGVRLLTRFFEKMR